MEIITTTAVSYEEIRNDLLSYVESVQDEAWKDFLEGSAGTTIQELMAGLGAYLSYHMVALRRESSISTARLRSSLISMASLLGYPANRPSVPIVTVTVTVAEAQTLSKGDVVGHLDAIPLSALTSQTLAPGTEIIHCAVGEWVTQSTIPGTSERFARVFVQDEGINNDFTAEVDSTEYTLVELRAAGALVPMVKAAELMNSTNVNMVTHYGGVFLVFGDGTFGYQIIKDVEIELSYFKFSEILDFTNVPVDLASSTVDVGTLTAVEVVTPGSNEDSNAKLAALAPGYHSARRRMVTADDHTNIFHGYEGDVVSANCRRATDENECCSVEMSYLFADEHVIDEASLSGTTPELTAINNYLDTYRVVGEQILFIDPTPLYLQPIITVVIETGAVAATVQAQILTILQSATMTLASTFKVGDIHRAINEITGVLRVYFEQPQSDKVLSFSEYLSLDQDFFEANLTITSTATTTVTVTPTDTGYSYT